MKVVVEVPAIDGETVRFRWSQSAPNLFQHVETFFFRYEGIDLRSFALELFYEIFLALQVRVFAAYDEPVEVYFPTPLPRPTAEYWLAFHETDIVTIAPVAEVDSYSPWVVTPHPHPAPRSAAVFFGGGKDSMLAASMLSELRGADQVLLVQFIGPMRDEPKLWSLVEHRQENLMLRPAREGLGLATQRVWTDYQAQFRPEGYGRRPHLELYTVGSLPALLARGVSLCAFCIGRMPYHARRAADGTLVYKYAKSRPEIIATQSRHYQRTLGVDLTVTNVNLPFHNLHAIQLLAERYPAAHRQIVMCTKARVDERWCYACAKCALFALHGLYLKAIDPKFDYDRFFRESPFVASLAAYAESGVDLTVLGNAPWQPFLCNPRSYLLTCHILAMLDLDDPPIRLSPTAHTHLMLAKALFGNRPFPDQLAVWQKSLDLLGPELRPAIGAIAKDHFPIGEAPEIFLSGAGLVEFELDGAMPTRTALLAHLRDT